MTGRTPLLALDFGGTKVEVALAGPGQRILRRRRLQTHAERGAGQVIDRALAAARGLLADAGLARPAAVGVSTMGFTREDRVDLAPNVPGWEDLRLPGLLRAAFAGVPLALENDVRAAACAELRWGALAGVQSAVYVNLGTGIAATLIVGGAPFAGAHGAAGEIAYWRCPAGLGSAPEADADDTTMLEAAIGGAGIACRARAMGLAGGLAELMASADPRAAALVREVMTQLAVHLANLATVLDPELMVLGGGFTQAGERLLGPVRDGLRRYAPFPPELTIGRFGRDVGLYGAIALADAAASP